MLASTFDPVSKFHPTWFMLFPSAIIHLLHKSKGRAFRQVSLASLRREVDARW